MRTLRTTYWVSAGLLGLFALVAMPAAADFVINDDLIVDGSACIGFDCVNGEVFSFDTIRMKENNLRIKADDTSVVAGFPTQSWTIVFNDSASGGRAAFQIHDENTELFTIETSNNSHALYVDDGGRLGLGTSTPSVELHIIDGDTPALRLQQDGSSGFAPQSWDVAGNETNFFIRDVTNGSTLPLRIRPGADSNALFIDVDNSIGLGTASPEEHLHMNGSGTQKFLIRSTNTGVVGFDLQNNGATTGQNTFTTRVASNGNITLSRQGVSPVDLQIVGSTGDVNIENDLNVAGTKNFRVADPADSSQWIVFSALEGPEAGTYYRGSARTVNGKAVIELPDYFTKMTETEGLTVQLTSVGGWHQLYVDSKSPERLVVLDAQGGDDVEFDFFVQGIRKGYADFEVERPVLDQ